MQGREDNALSSLDTTQLAKNTMFSYCCLFVEEGTLEEKSAGQHR